MRIHRVIGVAALACAAVLLAREAPAAGRPVKLTSLEGVPFRKVYLPGTSAAMELCKVGIWDTPVGAIGDQTSGGTIYFHEADTYWTYIELRPDSCPGCSNLTFGKLGVAHLTLYFPFAPETVTVNVSVVQSVPIPCHYPNTDAIANFCATFQYTFDCQDSMTVVDYAIPIPPGCAVPIPDVQPGQIPKGPAFIGFEFVTANDTTQLHKPQIAVRATGTTCMSYNPVGFFAYDIVAEYGVGNPVMYAEVTACESVPVLRKTWGQLKRRYR
jgi:hypothetical protein